MLVSNIMGWGVGWGGYRRFLVWEKDKKKMRKGKEKERRRRERELVSRGGNKIERTWNDMRVLRY